jgi:uncharacterized protein YbjT (DUF2867 family)
MIVQIQLCWHGGMVGGGTDSPNRRPPIPGSYVACVTYLRAEVSLRETNELEVTVTSTFLVTGGTGTLGRRVVPLLLEADRNVRVLSRRRHDRENGVEYVMGDLATGNGVEAAVDGIETIVHCAGSAKGDEVKARNLVRAASGAHTRHLVFVSVVGADRVPVSARLDRAMFGYFAAKLAAERVVADSGLPWTTLRATQFHDLILMVTRQLAKLPVVLVPAGFRFQPIDTGEVAARLVELALAKPAGLVPDIAGPRVYEMTELVRSYLRAYGKRRLIVPLPIPGPAARAVRAGATLAPNRAVGHRTWEALLTEESGFRPIVA